MLRNHNLINIEMQYSVMWEVSTFIYTWSIGLFVQYNVVHIIKMPFLNLQQQESLLKQL